MLKSKDYFVSVVARLNILEKLRPFNALWVGTIPIDVHIENSDVDIICYYDDTLETFIKNEFKHEDGLSLTITKDVLTARFLFESVPFEIFAERKDPLNQYGYLHMKAEERLLELYGDALRERVRALKRKGLKTEPAFAQALNLSGDPYIEILKYYR